MKAEWIKIVKCLPKEGQLCDIRLQLPKGYHYNLEPEWMKKMDEENGVAGKKKNEVVDEIMENKIFHCKNGAEETLSCHNYYWAGLRTDMPPFVTHWRPAKDD